MKKDSNMKIPGNIFTPLNCLISNTISINKDYQLKVPYTPNLHFDGNTQASTVFMVNRLSLGFKHVGHTEGMASLSDKPFDFKPDIFICIC